MAEVVDILLRLAAAGILGACIGFERRVHHKAIGIAGIDARRDWKHNVYAARPPLRRG